MQPDTTFVAPVTQVLSNPAVMNMLIAALAGIIAYIVGLIRIPKGLAAKIVQYAAIIVIAIFESQEKAKVQEARGTALLTGLERENIAIQIAETTIQKSPNRDIFGKITKTLGGIGSVVKVAYPIVKPFLKKG